MSSIILDGTRDRGHDIEEVWSKEVDGERFSLLWEDDGYEISFRLDEVEGFDFFFFFFFDEYVGIECVVVIMEVVAFVEVVVDKLSEMSFLSSIMLEDTWDRGHDVAEFGGELDVEELLEVVVTLISLLSSIIFEVTRDRGVDIAVLVVEELIWIVLFDVIELVGM